MSASVMEAKPAAIKYDVQVSRVKEVTLVGSADLAYWTQFLAPRGFFPACENGEARLLVSAADAKFLGVPFREVSISVFVSREEGGSQRDGAYLLHAYNSVRFFAWVERAMFKTPYHHAGVKIESRRPAGVRVSHNEHQAIVYGMSADSTDTARTPSGVFADGWAGPIFLHQEQPVVGDPGKLFFGKIEGLTRHYAFDRQADTLEIAPSAKDPALQHLVDSKFTGLEWHIREDANHGKSKTVSRATAGAF